MFHLLMAAACAGVCTLSTHNAGGEIARALCVACLVVNLGLWAERFR